ncbi:hypothetical protein VSVS12_01745 [Vibrio scophthalmi]|uniref:Uncharacterized protein n=1 Tax=Vibrio scophthalmi TaxID=45658 RepID=A0A1B1NP49_9VIBR|nr:hypothetical protein VSVS12_01745 [Vibrio scophthalmi]ANU36496.1 hypothetical protein VSVS05_01369 [Vibrio scophthalmi]ODS11450.1 hypothetical protein VSF3289_01715 [Vibrio scophthalmi]
MQNAPVRNRGKPAGDLVCLLFSLIRTMTVGSGISPDLLTSKHRALAGSSKKDIPPVGTFTLP